jgi:hypothetical protein
MFPFAEGEKLFLCSSVKIPWLKIRRHPFLLRIISISDGLDFGFRIGRKLRNPDMQQMT